jgi:hypothetical protein
MYDGDFPKAAQQKAIRTVKISKLTDDLYPDRFLWFDKFPVE